MPKIKSLRVDLGSRSYPILVGDGILETAGLQLQRLGFSTPPIVISNGTVLKLYGDPIMKSLKRMYGTVPVIRIGDGERFKNHTTLLKIYDALFRTHADRCSWLLALGGGVVGDITGFAASTFMRGIRYVSIPTTLLAQVDSSVGGKVGINVVQGKNLIGAFHQPSAVLTDTRVLKSLPDRELAAGLYEVIKCGAIRSLPLLRYIDRNLIPILKRRSGALQHIILEALRIKAAVVARDEVENNLRMILNFGHTVGHALEAATEYRGFKHGEAVGWGMLATLGYGAQLGHILASDAAWLAGLIHRVENLPSLKSISFDLLWRALMRDKKFRAGEIKMILLRRLGDATIVPGIDRESLSGFLKEFVITQTASVTHVRQIP